MKQRIVRLADKYRSLALFAVLLLLGQIAFSQSYTTTSAWGYKYRNVLVPETLSIPADTFAIPAQYQNQPFIAYKDSLIYLWSPTLHRWNTSGSAVTGTPGGTGGVDFLTKQNYGDTATYDASRWWVLQQLNSYTPTTRFLDSMQAARFTYLKAGDTTYLHNQLLKLTTNNAANSNLLFANGVVYSSVTNTVSALYQSPIWNANRFQGYPVDAVICNGCVPYLDSANRIIRWRRADSAAVTPIYDSIAQINLDLLATKLALHDSANRIWNKLNNIGFYANQNQFTVRPAGTLVGDKDTLELSQPILDKINEVTTPGNYPTYPDFSDSLQAHWAAIMQRYTAAQSDARYYPLSSNPANYLTGSGAVNQLALWNSTYTLSGSSGAILNNGILTLSGTGATGFATTIPGYNNDFGNDRTSILLGYHGGTQLVGYGKYSDTTPLRLTGVLPNSSPSPASVPGIALEARRGQSPILPDEQAVSFFNGIYLDTRIGTMWGNGNFWVKGRLQSDSLRYATTLPEGVKLVVTDPATGKLYQSDVAPDGVGGGTSLTLTTTGTSGPATYEAGVLNIPTYSGGTSQWTTSGSNIYYNSGNVLIGTGVSDGHTLRINGSVSFNLGGDAYGDMWYRDSTGSFHPIPKGTSGQVLTWGSNNKPSFATSASTSISSTDNALLPTTGATVSTNKTPYTITYSATPTLNVANSLNQRIVLTGNATFTFSGAQGGDYFALNIVQDGTGGRTVTWPSSVKWKGGVAPTLTTAANATDKVIFYYNSVTGFYEGVYGLDFK